MPEVDEEIEEQVSPSVAPEPIDQGANPNRQEAQQNDDVMSDLFDVSFEADTQDIVTVDIEKDIVDGDLSEVTEVSEEDILGDSETGQMPLEYTPDSPRQPPPRSVVRRVTRRPVPPQASAGGIR